MSVGSADLVKGLVAIWISSGLETVFKDAWSTADKAEFVALSDTQAEGSHPHPYCVFEVADGETVARMTSAGSSYNWEIRDVPVTFTIYTKDQGGTESAKSAAARLAEEVMKVFGGHPSV